MRAGYMFMNVEIDLAILSLANNQKFTYCYIF